MLELKEAEVIVSSRIGPIPLATYSGGTDGETVVFVHGLLHSAAVWEGVMAELGRDYHVVAFDLPGFGNSPAPCEKTSLGLMTDAVDGMLSWCAQRKPPVGIVADSLGALAFLLGLPAVGRRGLCALLSGCPSDGLAPALRVLGLPGLIRVLLRLIRLLPVALAGEVIARLTPISGRGRSSDLMPVVKGVLRAEPRSTEVLFRQIRAAEWQLPSDRGATSITILRGECDPVVSRKTGVDLAGRLGAKYVELPGVGHTPMLEDPTGLCSAFRAALARYSG